MSGIPFVRDMRVAYGEAIEVIPGVRRVLARNPGPFTFHGTGTLLVGATEIAVIDPGPADPEHVAAILRAAAPAPITTILVTHSHRDHSPAAQPLQEATGAPIYGFGALAGHSAWADDNDGYAFRPDHRLADGDWVAGNGWRLDAVHTPGHMSNHLCYALTGGDVLFTGDHVMGWSTTLVSAPDGDMGAYMASLRRLLTRRDRMLIPAHGPEITEPRPFLAALLAHREERERQVLDCLAAGITAVPAMVRRLYVGLDPKLAGAAGWSVESHLFDLAERGLVRRHGERWRLARAA